MDLSNFPFNIILASGSPRRKELLEKMGLQFEVCKTDVDESFPDHLKKADVAEYLAKVKADFFKEVNKTDLIITADTIVCLGDAILNKPANREEAIEMLQQLSGQKHEVITGVHLKTSEKSRLFSTTTTVHFKPLSLQEITYYVDHYQPYDKAGAYGIQEWIGLIGIEKLEGSYFNVVGLPVAALYDALKEF